MIYKIHIHIKTRLPTIVYISIALPRNPTPTKPYTHPLHIRRLSSHFDILATYTEASETMLGKKCNGHLTSKLSSSSVSESPAKLVAPPCKKCRGPGATKRCSTCKQAWYCRRQCQVDDWPTHQRHCRPATEQQAVENCKAGYGEAGSMALKRSPPPPPPPAAAAPKKSFDC